MNPERQLVHNAVTRTVKLLGQYECGLITATEFHSNSILAIDDELQPVVRVTVHPLPPKKPSVACEFCGRRYQTPRGYAVHIEKCSAKENEAALDVIS